MADAGSQADLQALQGDWQQVAFEKDGIDDPPDDHGAPNATLSIAGNRYRVFTPEGDLILEGTFELDTAATPRCMVWTDDAGAEGKRSLTCSYRIDGDRFAFVGALDGGPHPTEFRAGRGQVMRTFARRR